MQEQTREWVTTTTILRDLLDAANGAAWERFVGRFRAPLLAFVVRLGVPDRDAEDVAQQALMEFASLCRERRYERERGRLSSWLFGIARRCVLRHRQNAARSREREAPGGGDSFWAGVEDEQSAADVWNAEWERWAWSECLRRAGIEFEAATMRAFLLATRDGRPASAVAEELGVPVKAVYNAKHRVLKRLRELRDELEAVES